MTDPRTVPVYDARAIASELTLDRNGLAFTREASAVTDFRTRPDRDGL